jgi:hypothetical protein
MRSTLSSEKRPSVVLKSFYASKPAKCEAIPEKIPSCSVALPDASYDASTDLLGTGEPRHPVVFSPCAAQRIHQPVKRDVDWSHLDSTHLIVRHGVEPDAESLTIFI